MQNTAERKLKDLLRNNAKEEEVHFNIGEEVLRLNLKTDDMMLWSETLKNIDKPVNILLACESNQNELNSTKLTWVVGAAIRSTKLNSKIEIIDLLKGLAIPNDLAEAVFTHCPGLGTEITWAFYLERHGWLTASPVIDIKQLSK